MGKFRQLLSIFSLSVTLGTCALAQNNLTQIRDTVTNPDGSPFNGTVVITFNGFFTTSSGSISPLSTSARIYNGALSVLLVPSTTAGTGSYYQAAYHSSDGTITWTETWSVPVSANALSVSAVRTSSSSGTTSGGSSGGSGGSSTTYATLPIAITDVTNLSSQLSTLTASLSSLTTSVTANGTDIATLKTNVSSMNSNVTSNSSALAALTSTVSGLNSSVSANSSSLSGLNTTVNTLSTTVTNLGSSLASLSASIGSSGQTVPYSFVDGETPTGTIDGSNTSFTLNAAPSPTGSLELYRNGLVQTSGVDYTISGKNLSFLAGSIPVPTDILQAYYRVSGSSNVSTFADNEAAIGTVDGSNLRFTVAFAPSPAASLKLYKNGMLLRQSADYTLSGSTITFVTGSVPHSGDSIIAFYRH